MELISTIWHSLLNLIGAAHPVLLFFGLALLPLAGVPTSPLWIAVGVRLGTATGFVMALGGLLLNYTIAYWLARRWLRQPLARWLESRAWRIPQVKTEDESLLILLLRLTPGLPLFVQNYLLGLAEVRFGRYLLLSALIQAPQVLAFVWFGNSLAENAVWRLLLGGGALVALSVLVILVRRVLKRRASPGFAVTATPTQS